MPFLILVAIGCYYTTKWLRRIAEEDSIINSQDDIEKILTRSVGKSKEEAYKILKNYKKKQP